MFQSAFNLKILIAVGATTPVVANAQSDPSTYWESDQWRVVAKHAGSKDFGWCELTRKQLEDTLRFFRGGAEAGYLQYQKRGLEENARSSYDVRWIFDGEEFRGSVFGPGIYSPIMQDALKVQRFKMARRLAIVHGGETVAEISLAGSFRAHEKLSECAGQWPDGRVPVMPPPPPATRRSASVNRDPIPIQPVDWFTAADIPTIHHMRSTTVNFVLAVGADGSVTSCAINEPSEYPLLDKTTCRKLTQRARFQPATNAAGQPIAGEFSGSVRVGLPE